METNYNPQGISRLAEAVYGHPVEEITPGEIGALETALDSFTRLLPRGRKVLSEYYGIEDGKPKTLEQIGKKLEVTRERVRQIRNWELRRLKRSIEDKGGTQ